MASRWELLTAAMMWMCIIVGHATVAKMRRVTQRSTARRHQSAERLSGTTRAGSADWQRFASGSFALRKTAF